MSLIIWRRLVALLCVVGLLLLTRVDAIGAEPVERSSRNGTAGDEVEPETLDRQFEQLFKEGLNLYRARRYAEAGDVLGQALAVARARRTMRYADVGHVLLAIGATQYAQTRLRRAQASFEGALDAFEQVYPPARYPDGHRDLAASLTQLGTVHQAQGNFELAKRYAERALSMRERLFPEDSDARGRIAVAGSLTRLGSALRALGDHDLARERFHQALAITRRVYSEEKYPLGHPYLATSLNNLGAVAVDQGDYEEAERYYHQALKINARLYSKEEYPDGHRNVASGLTQMGLVLREQGNYERSRDYYEQALAMDQRLYPKNEFPAGHPDLATSLHNLGTLLQDQGEYEYAGQHFRLALEMFRGLYPESEYPEGHPHIATALNSMGALLYQQGRYEEARSYFEQTIEMRRRVLSKAEGVHDHPNIAVALNNLATVLHAESENEQARGYYEQALAMSERLYLKDARSARHPYVAAILTQLGRLHVARGEFEVARGYFERALEMNDGLYSADRYPEGHPDLAMSLYNLGSVLVAQRGSAKAQRKGENAYQEAASAAPDPLALLERAAVMENRLATSFYAGASEAEALNYAAARLSAANRLLSEWTRSSRSIEDLYAILWERKGSIQEVLTSRQRVLAATSSSDLRREYRQYLRIRRDIARLTMAPTAAESVAWGRTRERLTALGKEKERLERSLADQVEVFSRRQEHRSYRELTDAMPRDVIFIDFRQYLRFEPEVGDLATFLEGVRSYVAFILRKGQPVVRVELGPAAEIDDTLETWRVQIQGQIRGNAAVELRRLIWEPLKPHLLPPVQVVFLAPEGALTRLPWSALPGRRKESILLERYAISVVPSGAFLLDRLTARASGSSDEAAMLAVGDVSYGDASSVVAGIRWRDLPGTKVEVEDLGEYADQRDLRTLTGEKATPDRVLAELPKVRWAHLATHGFFADPILRSALALDEEQLSRPTFHGRYERTRTAERNPLVFSGLVLAGANLSRPRDELGVPLGDGGMLTAEAIAGLPLQNLELAVLSACETGVGNVAGGEGVFGLQRAFHIAGTRSVMASLWKVSDQATAALMRVFYHQLWVAQVPAVVALQQAQLAIYRNPARILELGDARGPRFDAVVKLVTDPGLQQDPRETAPAKLWAAFLLSGGI